MSLLEENRNGKKGGQDDCLKSIGSRRHFFVLAQKCAHKHDVSTLLRQMLCVQLSLFVAFVPWFVPSVPFGRYVVPFVLAHFENEHKTSFAAILDFNPSYCPLFVTLRVSSSWSNFVHRSLTQNLNRVALDL